MHAADERDHGCELELRMGDGHVAPHELVAVEDLLVGTGAALEQVAQIELVARARREEQPVAERQEEWMAHHVDREGA